MIEPCQTTRQFGIRQRSLRHQCRMGRATELVVVLATGAMLVIGGQSKAQTWEGAIDSDFTNPENYVDDLSPVDGDVLLDTNFQETQPILAEVFVVDSVTINDGFLTLQEGANLTASDITVNAPGELGVNPGATLHSDVTVIEGAVYVAGILDGAVTLDNNGYVSVYGTVTGAVTANSGYVHLRAGSIVGLTTINGGMLQSRDDIRGGEFLNSTLGDVHVGAGASYFYNDRRSSAGAVYNEGTVENGGTIASVINKGGQFTNFGTVSGTVTVNGGEFSNRGTLAEVSVDSSGAFNNLESYNGSVVDVVTNAGTSSNEGTISSVVNTGGTFINFGNISTLSIDAGTFDNEGTVTTSTTINGGVLNVNTGSNLNTSSPVMVNGGTVNLNTDGISVTSLAGAGGTIDLHDNTLTLVGSDIFQMSTLAGTITGSGGLTIDAAHLTQTFTGPLSYTGATTITEGALQLGASNILSDASAVLIDGGTLDMNGFDDTVGALTLQSGWITGDGMLTSNGAIDVRSGTIKANLAGTGGLEKTTDGTVTLSGNNTYTGATIVDGGTVSMSGGSSINDLGHVQINAGVVNFNDSETIGSIGGDSGTVNISGDLQILTTGGNGASTTFAGTIVGDGILEKVGTGALTLSGASTHIGGTFVNDGQLYVTGSIAGSVLVSDATLRIGNTDAIGGSISAGGATILYNNGVDEASQIILERDGIARLGVGGTDAATQSGVISESFGSSHSIEKIGTGTLTLTAANTYSGATVISEGVLHLAEGGTLGQTGSLAGPVTIASEATLELGGNGHVFNSMKIAGDGTGAGAIVAVAGENNSLEGSITLVDDATIGTTNSASSLGIYGGITGNDHDLTFAGTGDVNVNGDIATGMGSLTSNVGNLLLIGTNSYTGGTYVNAGTLVIDGGSALSDAGAVTVEAEAILRVLYSERIGSLTNRGSVDLSGPSGTPETILTVAGNYSAASDLYLDVVLGDDSSATDQLMVEGATSGATSVFVTNRGGTGAQTSTGILVVDVVGASNGSFTLVNGDVALPGGETGMSVGNYVYTLRDVAGDWYLQSQLQPTTVVYEVLPSALIGMMQSQGFSQRLAGRQMLTRGPDAQASEVTASSRGLPQGNNLDGAWLSVSGAHVDVTPDGSSTNLSYDQSTWRLQSGLDMVLHDGAAGTWVGGASVFVGGGSLDATSALGGGTVASDARGISLTATWLGDTGFYADLQLEYSRFSSDISSSTSGVLAEGVDGTGRMASVEMGQAIALQNGLTLTPQAQLTWADVRMDSFTGSGGALISAGDSDSLQMRLGVAAERSWTTDTGSDARLYGIANFTREFRGESSVLIDSIALDASAPDWTAEIGLGGSYDWEDRGNRSSLYGEITATRAISGGDLTGVAGTVGLRVTW